MTWLRSNRLNILMNYLNIVFILRVLQACYSIQNFNYILVTALYLIGIIVFWAYHEAFEKKKYNVLITFLTIASMWIIIFTKKSQILDYYYNSIAGNYNSINEALYAGAYTYFEMYKPFMVVLIPFIAITLLFLNSKGLNNGVLVLSLSVLIFFWYLGYTGEVKVRLLTFLILSAATYAANSYIYNVKQVSKIGIQVILDKDKIITSIIAYSIIIAWIVTFLPQQYQGKYSQTDDKRWTNPFGPEIGDSPARAKQSKYGLGSSGYNNTEKRLGGPIILGDELEFRVDADGAYYLRGDTKDFYTGSSWRRELEEYEKNSDLSALNINKYYENMLGINKDSPIKSLTVYPENINSSTLFTPVYPRAVKLEKGDIYYDKIGLTFANSGKVTREYTVDFYDPGMVLDTLGWKSHNRDINFSRINYEKYLQLPDSVTVRTAELVFNLVKDLKTNKEKVNAIKDYLSINYPYSLEVSQIPEGVDFVDYFLFTEKKGYCVYFATAMTVMTRIAGIPARYVEGFKMPDETVNGYYEVTSEQAHAWTEVLFQQSPEVWVTIDNSPTPAEDRQRRQQEEETTGPDEAEPLPETNPDNMPAVPPVTGVETHEQSRFDITLSPQTITMMSGILLLFLVVLLRLVIFSVKKKRMFNSDSIIPMYSYILKRVNSIGIRKSELYTDREFVREIYDIELRDKMMELVDKVYDEFYGGTLDVEYNKSEMYKFIEKHISKRQNPFKYNFIKYFR